jgi:phosphotransferase system enzyme I (PtsI)
LDKVQDGQTVIIDGSTGKIYVDPDAETSKKLQEQISKAQAEAGLLASLKAKQISQKVVKLSRFMQISVVPKI